MENFKAIKGTEGRYWISDLGRVFDCKKQRIAHQFKTGGKDLGCYLAVAINRKPAYIHRLVAEAFIENPEAKPQVDHVDGDKLNNNLDNLRWATHAENQHNKKKIKGYCWVSHAQKWKAEIRINSEKIYLGYYASEEEARQAYLDAKKIYHPTSPIV